MTQKRSFGEEEYYHVFNRGFQKSTLFRDDSDRKRFLFYILHYQSSYPLTNIQRYVTEYDPVAGFPVPEVILKEIITSRAVDLVSFCLMSNHFHLIVKERLPGGISLYMQRVGTAYTRYFNTRYDLSGHVFEDRYKAKHISDNNYLLYLSAYIHRNPSEIASWQGKEFDYPWSSLQDFTEGNRWGGLLQSDIIADQFNTTSDSNYKDFIKTSTAKVIKEELENLPEF